MQGFSIMESIGRGHAGNTENKCKDSIQDIYRKVKDKHNCIYKENEGDEKAERIKENQKKLERRRTKACIYSMI